MRIIKKLIYTIIAIFFSLLIYSKIVSAATVKVTTETLYLREKASTNATIITMIGQDEECELLDETTDWYKVKYKTYTGYISKEYAQKKGEKKNNTPKKEDSKTEQTTPKKENDTTTSEQAKEETKTTTPVTKQSNTKSGKILKNTAVKILPLIQSSEIASINKNDIVTIVTEMNGWTYIQNKSIAGWLRSDMVTASTNTSTTNNSSKKEETKTTSIKKEEKTTSEKTMYVNDDFVNVRKSASTNSDIVMTLKLNTKLTVIAEEGDWYKVKTSEGNAYISKELLSDKEKGTTSRGKVVRGATDNLSETAQKELTAVNNKTTTTKATNTKPTSTSTSNSSKGKEIVEYAKKFLGVPYVYGGASSRGFDCSGFTMYVYKKFGISLPHGAEKQSHYGKAVKANKNSSTSLKNNLKAGDIILFLDYETMDDIGHCGIYIGDGYFIHASSGSGYCVKTDNLLPGNYYNKRYCGARRII